MKPWPCKWYKGDKIVSSDNIRDESKDQTYKLTILNATNEDEGVYTLMIRNEKKDVQLKVIERQEGCVHLRNYQLELATIALRGENTIICAESGAGKTIVSYHVIERHLLNNPRGKVVFISRTNILQEQQYERACDTFSTPHFQGTINIWKAEDDDSDDFKMEIQKANLIFSTPKSLCNHLMDATAVHVSIRTFTLIILDECHHAYGKSVYNELMSYYRMAKYGEEMDCLPQIVGLTSSPGINKVKDLTSAKGHLKQIMANLDVSKLSVVKRYKEELLRYTSIAAKVILVYKIRQHEPVKHILLQAMAYVESKMNSRIVSKFLIENLHQNRDLQEAIANPPIPRTEIRYLQGVAETKGKVEHVLHKDPKVPRLLHTCLRHLELYAECLEINSLFEVDQVHEVIMQGYADKSYENQNANTDEEMEIVYKLRETKASGEEKRARQIVWLLDLSRCTNKHIT